MKYLMACSVALIAFTTTAKADYEKFQKCVDEEQGKYISDNTTSFTDLQKVSVGKCVFKNLTWVRISNNTNWSYNIPDGYEVVPNSLVAHQDSHTGTGSPCPGAPHVANGKVLAAMEARSEECDAGTNGGGTCHVRVAGKFRPIITEEITKTINELCFARASGG